MALAVGGSHAARSSFNEAQASPPGIWAGAQLVVLTGIFLPFARIGWFLAETCQTVFLLQRENPYVSAG